MNYKTFKLAISYQIKLLGITCISNRIDYSSIYESVFWGNGLRYNLNIRHIGQLNFTAQLHPPLVMTLLQGTDGR